MKRPMKREVLVTSLIFAASTVVVLLLFTSSYQLSLNTAPTFGSSLPAGSSSGNIFKGLPSFGSNSNDIMTQNGPRVVNTSESLVGELRNGDFENVTGEILTTLNSEGGYVATSNLMFNGTTWLGIYSVSVPSPNATEFLFHVKNLVDENGKTTSIQISTQVVTGQTGGNQSKVEYSTFGMTLQEMALNSNGHPTQIPPAFQGVWPILVAILTAAAYVALIGLPLYLIILVAVIVSGRILYPLLIRVSKSSNSKRRAESPVT